MPRSRDDRGGREYRAGLRMLVEHRPDLAVKRLRLAVEACPARSPGALAERLYWLAVALLRLDRPEIALKSLEDASRLRPRGIPGEVYSRRANEYGMPRRCKPELDDFYAFYSVQAAAYFLRKGSRCFDGAAEKDAVVTLVGDAWLRLSRSGALKGLGPGDKLALFQRVRVDFPSFGLAQAGAASVIAHDFRGGRRDKPCPCGSGLPASRCCGLGRSSSDVGCE